MLDRIDAVRYAVSIHAPVRGATYDLNTEYLHPKGFNPRTREGCDTNMVGLVP